MDLSSLNKKVKKKKARKRIGRGNASGWGCTAGRGTKGQKSRSGYSRRLGFEGGQMPLFRRLPKRGFNNSKFRTVFVPVNVEMLKRFDADTEIKIEDYKNAGIVKNYKDGIKILGGGEIDRPLTVTAHRFSKSARAKIEKAGGKYIELLPVEEKKDKKKEPEAKEPTKEEPKIEKVKVETKTDKKEVKKEDSKQEKVKKETKDDKKKEPKAEEVKVEPKPDKKEVKKIDSKQEKVIKETKGDKKKESKAKEVKKEPKEDKKQAEDKKDEPKKKEKKDDKKKKD